MLLDLSWNVTHLGGSDRHGVAMPQQDVFRLAVLTSIDRQVRKGHACGGHESIGANVVRPDDTAIQILGRREFWVYGTPAPFQTLRDLRHRN